LKQLFLTVNKHILYTSTGYISGRTD